MEKSKTNEEEHSKQKTDSPVPTEATTCTSSPESSPNDDSKHSSIRRTLFKIHKKGSAEKETIDSQNIFENLSTSPVGGRAILIPTGGDKCNADTTSITSSETTAIPSWNLSTKDAKDKNVEVPLDHFISSQPVHFMPSSPNLALDQSKPILSSSSSFTSDKTELPDDNKIHLFGNESCSDTSEKLDEKLDINDTAKHTKNPSVVVEDPPKETTSCSAALNLAEIVFAFGQSARQRYQGSEQTGKAEIDSRLKIVSTNKHVEPMGEGILIGRSPSITTSRNLIESCNQNNESQSSFVRSIQRERDILKGTTKRDAHTILKLQQAIDTQKHLNASKEVEIVEKQLELQILEQQIQTLQKEQEDYFERETNLRETIHVLKKELDKVTLLKTVPSDELDSLKLVSDPSNRQRQARSLDNDTNVIDFQAQQARIINLVESFKEKEKENLDLQIKIDWLNKQDSNEKDELLVDVVGKAESDVLDAKGISENEEIESQLKEIIKRLEAVEIRENEKELDLATKSKGNSERKTCIGNQTQSEHYGVKIDVLEAPDAIETMSLKGQTNKIVNLEDQSTWCCGWSFDTCE